MLTRKNLVNIIVTKIFFFSHAYIHRRYQAAAVAAGFFNCRFLVLRVVLLLLLLLGWTKSNGEGLVVRLIPRAILFFKEKSVVLCSLPPALVVDGDEVRCAVRAMRGADCAGEMWEMGGRCDDKDLDLRSCVCSSEIP
ncbi:uncharacterized protein GGS22DRAFT_56202 [Annulohypoxylon maeteangense]|uniref:uncharacterized protein n=1 Tax=Annulohypoxylon maeteangense TaxID=1927788 RepID=UPI0020076709|nr:uncharacterized protein GGS22DRAFT_56202 [Annulohypoxylon maeteangense]KAI0881779.1 hypothetical protein GGS22DRAFT_56202 [Annulohypoxylon maeteangense]